jgi:ABC-type polar amino acid transport system ATPase subunit
MGLDFLERKLLERVLAPPPKLLFRQRQLMRALELAASKTSFVVYGPIGTGKTTLLWMVRSLCSKTLGAGIIYVGCASARTYSALRSKLNPAPFYLLDDYAMAIREPRLKELVRSLEPKAVVVYPPVEAYEELEGLEKIEMPAYTLEELEDICRERAARLALAVDEEDVRAAAKAGVEHGGNARVALMVLAERAAANRYRLAAEGYRAAGWVPEGA